MWAGYLGWQWRRVWTIQNEINELQKIKSLGFGVFEANGGGVNTWLRTGRVFPGLHLLLEQFCLSLVLIYLYLIKKKTKKGNETARNLHIALNAINVVLFLG
ncbi:P-loop containing nucleoside triphosphate hydrolases superfamily [Salix suchowensis]|nr:P-loop containing nucleoside triphosphate hydrolases superfamily [Salix suchowensis]